MPFPYLIDPDKRRARVIFDETVDGPGVVETLQALYQDPAWRPGLDVIWDGTAVRHLRVGVEDFGQILKQHVELGSGRGGRDVIVAVRDLDFLMAKMYAIHARRGPREVHVVRTLAAAEEPLDKSGSS